MQSRRAAFLGLWALLALAPAPELTVHTLTGERLAAAELWRDRAVLLDFWATWCLPCVRAMPELDALHRLHAGEGFSVVGLAVEQGPEGPTAVRRFLAQRPVSYPVYLDASDPPAWDAFGLPSIPAMALIDAEGHVVRQWSGDIDLREVEAAVVELLTPPGADPPGVR